MSVGNTTQTQVPVTEVSTPKTEEACYYEMTASPDGGIMFVGNSIGGRGGVAIINPSTGDTYTLAGQYMNGKAGIAASYGGIGLGVLFDGKLTPTFNLFGFNISTEGIGFGMFGVGSNGFTLAGWYYPLIAGFINTLPWLFQNASSLELYDHPIDHIAPKLLKNIFDAAIPIEQLLEKIGVDINPKKIPLLDSYKSYTAIKQILAEVLESKKFKVGIGIVYDLAEKAKNAHPLVRAEIAEWQDVIIRFYTQTYQQETRYDIQKNLRDSLSYASWFSEKYGEWLKNSESSIVPTDEEVHRFMASAMIAAQKMTMEAKQLPLLPCKTITTSAATSFEGIEYRYIETISMLSGILSEKNSGLYKFIEQKSEKGLGDLLEMVASGENNDKIMDKKFNAEGYLKWANMMIALLGQPSERIDQLRSVLKEEKSKDYQTAKGISLKSAPEMTDAFNTALKGSKNLSLFLSQNERVKELFDHFEIIYNLTTNQEPYYDEMKISEVLSNFVKLLWRKEKFPDESGYKIYQAVVNAALKQIYAEYRAGEASFFLSEAPERIEKFYERYFNAVMGIKDVVRSMEKSKDPRLRDFIEILKVLLDTIGSKRIYFSRNDITCESIDAWISKSVEEAKLVSSIIKRIQKKTDPKKDDDILEALDKYAKEYGLFQQMRNAMMIAFLYENKGGLICQK